MSYVLEEPLKPLKPMVSVIVAAYNIENYIQRCVQSLQDQVYSNIEIVIVDDGSSDRTSEIVESLARNDSRIVVVHKDNEGLPQARKTGFLQSSGDYICFVDGDDWFEPTYISELLNILLETDADFSACAYYLEYEESGRQVKRCHSVSGTVDSLDGMKLLHEHRAVFSYVWNKLFIRELVNNVVFPEHHIIGEDYTIVTQALEHSGTIALIQSPLCHYSQRAGTMSKSGFTGLDLIAFENYTEIKNKLVASYPQFEDVINCFIVLERDMGILFPMARAGNRLNDYNAYSQIINTAQKHARKYLARFIASSEPISMKVGALSLCISEKLFFFLYRFYFEHFSV